MFGTDFTMILLDTSMGGLEKYFNKFSELKSNFLCENSSKFMNRIN